MEFEDYLFIGVLVFFAFLIATAFTGFTGSSNRFDAWTDRCRLDGGQVVLISRRSTSEHYECYKNNTIIDHVED